MLTYGIQYRKRGTCVKSFLIWPGVLATFVCFAGISPDKAPSGRAGGRVRVQGRVLGVLKIYLVS